MADPAPAASPDAPAAPPHWTERLARSRWGMGVLSTLESTVLPVPIEALAVPLMIGHPRRALGIAAVLWAGCLVGALLFYLLALTLADPVVRPALDALGLLADFEAMTAQLGGAGLFWTVFLVSVTPVPMQLATLGAGAVGGNVLVFLAAVAVSRAIRYFGLALLAILVGGRLERLRIRKRVLVPALAAGMLAVWGILQLV